MGGVPSCFVRVRTNILRQDTSFYIDHFLPFLQRISQIAPDRSASVEFHQQPDHVLIQIVFDAETVHSIEQQQDGWQSILNRFKAHVERLTASGGT